MGANRVGEGAMLSCMWRPTPYTGEKCCIGLQAANQDKRIMVVGKLTKTRY